MVITPLRELLLATGEGAEYEDYSMLRVSPLMFLSVITEYWNGDSIGYAFFLNGKFWRIQEIDIRHPVYCEIAVCDEMLMPGSQVYKPDDMRLIRVDDYGSPMGMASTRLDPQKIEFRRETYYNDIAELTLYLGESSEVYLCDETNMILRN